MTTERKEFDRIVDKIGEIGKQWHSNTILENVLRNKQFAKKGLSELKTPDDAKKQSGIIISAGPSVHKFNVMDKVKSSNYSGTVVAVDGAMVKCLKNGIVPDYVVTLDPHPTRMIRWFGDSDFEKNSEGDDYFTRQDLDVEFRKNSIIENQKNIDLINQYADQIKLIICSTAPENVALRVQEAGFDCYWWNPIVDDPRVQGSLTREFFSINGKKCMNTGGTVGTAAWVFASTILQLPKIALTGMDLGYHQETPIEKTQTYYELIDFLGGEEHLADYFPEFEFPLTGKKYYTDPTYFWYRKNFLELVSQSPSETINCSEAGTLFSENMKCNYLSDFLKGAEHG